MPAITRRDWSRSARISSSSRVIAGAHEAAVALQQRQLVGQRRVEMRGSRSAGSAAMASQRGGEFRRQLGAREHRGDRGRRRQAGPQARRGRAGRRG